MPGSLIHLRLAYQLSRNSNNCPSYHFVVGNIVPDSGQKSPNGDYNPPKSLTHCKVPMRDGFTLGDWPFYQRHLLHRSDTSSAQHSFLMGYFCHLLTDNLWIVRAGGSLDRATLNAVDAQFLATHPDFHLPDAEALDIPPAIADFLPLPLIRRKVDETLKTFAHWSGEISASPAAIKQVDDFLDAACRCFTQIIGALESGIHPPNDAVSVLSFFRDGKF